MQVGIFLIAPSKNLKQKKVVRRNMRGQFQVSVCGTKHVLLTRRHNASPSRPLELRSGWIVDRGFSAVTNLGQS